MARETKSQQFGIVFFFFWGGVGWAMFINTYNIYTWWNEMFFLHYLFYSSFNVHPEFYFGCCDEILGG